MNKERLKTVVSEEIKRLPGNNRCHEAARRISDRLRLFGINVEVKDGIATYDVDSLFDCFLSSMDFAEELKQEILKRGKRKKVKFFHSWCEIFGDRGDVIVIDWHALMSISRDESFEKVLIVESKNNLPHTYNPGGKIIGKWLILRRFPPYVTRLRI